MRRLIPALAALVLAGTLATGGAALAKDHGDGEGRGHARGSERYERNERYERRGEGREGAGRWSRGADGRWRDGGSPRYDGGPPAIIYEPPVRRGGYAPRDYREGAVGDYGRYRLRPPPPGYMWVRTGQGYAMVSTRTGQVFDVVPY